MRRAFPLRKQSENVWAQVGSAPLELAKKCVLAVSEMERERNIERLRELLRTYVIPAPHNTVDAAREVLRCVERMGYERSLPELRSLAAR